MRVPVADIHRLHMLCALAAAFAVVSSIAGLAKADQACFAKPDIACLHRIATSPVPLLPPDRVIALALAEARLGKLEEARATLDRLPPDWFDIHHVEPFDLLYVGEALGRIGDRRRASIALEKARDLVLANDGKEAVVLPLPFTQFRDSEIILTAAYFHVAAGEADAALVLVERALAAAGAIEIAAAKVPAVRLRQGDYANVILFAAIVHARAGDAGTARRLLAQAMIRAPLAAPSEATAHAGTLPRLVRLRRELGEADSAPQLLADIAQRIHGAALAVPYDEAPIVALLQVLTAHAVLRDKAGAAATLLHIRALVARAATNAQMKDVPDLLFLAETGAGNWRAALAYLPMNTSDRLDKLMQHATDAEFSLHRWGALGDVVSALLILQPGMMDDAVLQAHSAISILRLATESIPY